MKKFTVLAIVLLFVVSPVLITALDGGKIVYENIVINHGILLVTPKTINEIASPRESISNQVILNLSSNLTREFNVIFYSEGEISNWINFEEENLTIRGGENFLNFNINVPQNAVGKDYSGKVIMGNEGTNYPLVDIIITVQSPESNPAGGGFGSNVYRRIEYAIKELLNNEEEKTPEEEFSDNDLPLDDNKTADNNLGFISRITGAVIGAIGKVGAVIIVVFIVMVVVSSIAVRIIRKRRFAKN